MATKAQINAAKKLLEKEGFTITKSRPDPRIGDVIRFHYDAAPYDVLITFHQTDSVTNEDVYPWGGVRIGEGVYAKLDTDICWIDSYGWARDDGHYEVIGHVDLDKYIKR